MAFTVVFRPRVTVKLKPDDLSPSTQSLQILTDGIASVVVDLTPSSPACAPDPNAAGSYVCTARFTVTAGTHVFRVTAYDGAGAQGNVLSTNSTVPVQVAATGTTTVPIVLEGVARYVFLTLNPANPPVGKAAAIALTAIVEDADHNLIVGPAPFDFPIELTTSDAVNGPLSKTVLRSPADLTGLAADYSGARVARITYAASAFGLSAANVNDAVLAPGAASSAKIYVANFYLGTRSTLTAYTIEGAPTGPIITGLQGADGVAVDGAGKIYVSNQLPGTVTTYAADGSPMIPTIAGFKTPEGVAVDAAGKIYVVDYSRGTVTTYLPDGSPTTPTIGTVGAPNDVAVDAAGKIYVTSGSIQFGCSNCGRVMTYNPDGSAAGPTIAGLQWPTGIAVDAAGKIYVVDYQTNELTSYDAQGRPTAPTIAGLDAPLGVAVDAAGKIYVVSAMNRGSCVATCGRVNTYNPDGSPSEPTITQGIAQPAGIAVR